MGQAFVTAARDLGAKVTEIAGGEYQKFKKRTSRLLLAKRYCHYGCGSQ
jgi:hypothetical protein